MSDRQLQAVNATPTCDMSVVKTLNKTVTVTPLLRNTTHSMSKHTEKVAVSVENCKMRRKFSWSHFTKFRKLPTIIITVCGLFILENVLIQRKYLEKFTVVNRDFKQSSTSNKIFHIHRISNEKNQVTDNVSIKYKEETRFNQNPENIYTICTFGIYSPRPRPDGQSGENRGTFTEQEDLRFADCKYPGCRFEPVQYKADVVMAEALELDRMYRTPRLPRLDGQLWILNTREPPMYLQNLPWSRLRHQFHLVNSYRRSSHIHTPYGGYTPSPNKVGDKPEVYCSGYSHKPFKTN